MAIRVIQWGTGLVGAESLRVLLRRDDLEVVGVWRHSANQVGRDIASLTGGPDTGIRFTNSLQEIVAIDADCVLYMPRRAHIDEVVALLASGKNVICTPFAFFAKSWPEADYSRIEKACAAGSSTLYGTGLNPGFAGMIQPAALLGMSNRVDHIRIEERANWSFYGNTEITLELMKFGSPAEEAALENNPFVQFNDQIFKEQISMLADALKIALDEVTTDQDLVLSDSSFDIRSGHIAAQTVCGQRYHWRGWKNGRSLIEIDALWNVGEDYPTHWPKPRDGWTVSIEGSPSMQTHFVTLASFRPDSGATLDDHVHSADIATAMLAVNSIPQVVSAAAGVIAAHQMPLAIPNRPFNE